MEIEYGFERNPAAHARFGAVWAGLLDDLKVLAFESGDATYTTRVRAHLVSEGTPIGPFDLQLAETALNLGLTLVTHNGDEFGRVPAWGPRTGGWRKG